MANAWKYDRAKDAIDTKAFAAEVYKAFLRCALRIIRSEDGAITAYDGDRVMAVFIGTQKNTAAVRAALKINWAVKNIIQPAIRAQYASSTYVLKHVIGIETADQVEQQLSAGLREGPTSRSRPTTCVVFGRCSSTG